jgi:hypothetical protein
MFRVHDLYYKDERRGCTGLDKLMGADYALFIFGLINSVGVCLYFLNALLKAPLDVNPL